MALGTFVPLLTTLPEMDCANGKFVTVKAFVIGAKCPLGLVSRYKCLPMKPCALSKPPKINGAVIWPVTESASLGTLKFVTPLKTLAWPSVNAELELSKLDAGQKITSGEVLFRKVDEDMVAAWAQRFGGSDLG